MLEVGQVVGRLTLQERTCVIYGGHRRSAWVCLCECGTTTTVVEYSLRGRTTSCGCYQRSLNGKIHWRHGRINTSEYRSWSHMINRCCNPRDIGYQDYGARGITVCESWKISFAQFFKDVGPKPSPKHSIDRIDNMRGYEPGNVRWATATEQARNRRSNHRLTIDGVTLTAVEWAERIGVSMDVIHSRLHRGWSDERAITPLRRLK